MESLRLSPSVFQRLQAQAAQVGLTPEALVEGWLDQNRPPTFEPFFRLFDDLPADIIICDAQKLDFPIVYVNQRFEETTGYRLADIYGRNPRFLRGNDSDQPGLETLRQALKTKSACRVTLRNYRQDGSPFWSDVHVAPLSNSAGEVAYMLGIQVDISAQKEAEAALHESNQRLQSLLDSQTSFIVRTDMQGRYTYVNSAFFDHYDWMYDSPENLPGRFSLESIIPEDHDKAIACVIKCIKAPEQPHQVILRKPKRDGGYFWSLWEFSAILDTQGQPVEIQCIGFDISEQKEAEDEILRLNAELEERVAQRTAELRLAKEQADIILQHAADAIVLTDVDGRILYVNPAWEELTGYRLYEVLQENPRILQSKRTPRQTYQELWATILRGQTWQGTLTNKRKSGEEYEAELIIVPVKNADGSPRYFVGVQRDITEKVKLEALKEQFIADAAHDLRSPLTSLKLRLSMLRQHPERLVQSLDMLDAQVSRMSHLVEDLLTLSRLDRQAESLILETLDLNPFLAELIEHYQPLAEARQQYLVFEGYPQAVYITGDVLHLERIMDNLVTNALNYTPEGGRISIQLSIRSGHACISVQDTGIGMSQDEIQHIYERFYRGKRARDLASGTGLGLAIVKQLMDLHHGTIAIFSQPMQGTRFELLFPLSSEGEGKPMLVLP
jgi:PAS domain S-box-containing protein